MPVRRVVLASIVLAAACVREGDDDPDAPGDDPVDDTEPAVTDDTDSDPPVEPGDAPATVTPLVCADPDARVADGPLVHEVVGVDPPDRTNGYPGAGASVADLDGDGGLDVIVTGVGRARVWSWVDGAWVEQVDLLPVEPTAGALAIHPVDVDDDGDLDLHVLHFGAPDRLVENDDGVFVGRIETGVEGTAERTTAASWGDLDGDGDLDLIVGSYGDDPAGTRLNGQADPTRVLLQGPAWTFTDVAPDLGDRFRYGWVYHMGIHDVNDDGLPEAVALRDFGIYGQVNAILWGSPQGLVPGDGTSDLEIASTAMGGGFGDFDGDGDVDLGISGWGTTQLLVQERGRWFDVAASVGFVPDLERRRTVSWGVELVDLDLDGRNDVVATFGPWRQQDGIQLIPDTEPRFNVSLQPSAVFLHTGPALEDVSEAWRFHKGPSRGLLAVDVDHDGWLDLVLKDLDGPAHVYRQRCGEARSVVVEPAADVSQALALTAKITVRRGDSAQVAWWSLGANGCCGSGPAQAVIGLGTDPAPVDVEVRWRDGVVSRVHGVPAGSRIRVGRPSE